MMSGIDEWNIGNMNKEGIWAFYVATNFLGVLLCSLLIFVVLRNEKRSGSDIFACGLASGCLTMSVTCSIQCLLNITSQRFYGGVIACKVEAIAHISAIVTEFVCVALISINMYAETSLKKKAKHSTIFAIVVIVWILCTAITCLLSIISPIYLMSAGTYCFFAFSSVAIAGWLIPVLLISLMVMLFCHYKLMRYFSRMLPSNETQVFSTRTPRLTRLQDIIIQQFQWRSTLFIIALFFGWGFAIVACVFEFVQQQTSEWLVTAVGTGGVFFSVLAPLVFFATSPRAMKCFQRKHDGHIIEEPKKLHETNLVVDDLELNSEITPCLR